MNNLIGVLFLIPLIFYKGGYKLDTLVKYCNCYFLDSDYNNTVYFQNLDKQTEFFNKYTLFVDEECSYQRKNNNMKVRYSLDELKLINYLVVYNSNGEKFFYFVIDKIYIGEDVTELILQLDVIQTYLFKINFKSCLVEREHIKEYDILTNSEGTETYRINNELSKYINEGLDTGEYFLKNSTDVYDYFNNGCYIFTSSEMLGVSDDERLNIGGSSGGDTPSSSSNFLNGYLNENGLVFLKSKEGFVGSAYQDINGYWTIGYGITQAFQETYYNKLYPTCTEQQASEVMGEVVYNFSSQVKTHLESISKWDGWVNQDKLNALTSFAYQNGVGGLLDSPIWSAIENNNSDEEIANAIKTYGDYTDRRLQESQMFLGVYPSEMKITDHTNGGYVTSNGGKGYIPSEYQ